MFAALYQVTRDHRGLAQFARVAMVMRKYADAIAFPVPVRAVMSVVATLASLFGARIDRGHQLPARGRAGAALD
jgi:hypothetical protein